ncbi:MAG: hypothetical protein WCW61_01375 [Patescibacteria group bacterium]|jgi:hypothetical protein
MIKIYFNPSYPELIFSIAAIMRSLSEKHLISLIAATPWEIDCNENILKKNIFNYAENLIEEVALLDEENGTDEVPKVYQELSSTEKIYLLNICPTCPEDNINLISFLDRHRQDIELWTSAPENWSPGALAYLRSENSEKIIIDGERRCLEILKDIGIVVQEDWREAAKEFVAENARNRLAARYLASLAAACIIDNNGFEKGAQNYFNTLAMAANEIWSGIRDAEIDQLVIDFVEADEEMKKVKELLKTGNQYFLKAQAAGRPIGYLDLKDLKKTFNLLDLLECGSEEYPWLFIVSCTIGDQRILNLASKELPQEILKKYQQEYEEASSLLLLLEAEVINFKK